MQQLKERTLKTDDYAWFNSSWTTVETNPVLRVRNADISEVSEGIIIRIVINIATTKSLLCARETQHKTRHRKLLTKDKLFQFLRLTAKCLLRWPGRDIDFFFYPLFFLSATFFFIHDFFYQRLNFFYA